MQIDVGRLDGFVTEPQRDHGAVDAVLLSGDSEN